MRVELWRSWGGRLLREGGYETFRLPTSPCSTIGASVSLSRIFGRLVRETNRKRSEKRREEKAVMIMISRRFYYSRYPVTERKICWQCI